MHHPERPRLRRPAFRALVVVGALLSSWTASSGDGPGTGAGAAAPDPLIVHEWGTFTSMVGVGGVGLDGLQHEEEGLPEFVYSRSEVRDCPLRAQGWKGLEVPAKNVTHKMETPVIYVHSRTPRSLRVRVDFVGGLISQWYPVSDLLGPPEAPCDAGPLDLARVERSFLEWDVDVIPRTAGAPADIPAVAADDPWAYAREVESAYLRTRPRQSPERAGPVEAEHYLFYRGLGRLDLPFGGRARPGGELSFVNGAGDQVSQVVWLEVGPPSTQEKVTVPQVGRYDITCYVDAQTTARATLKDRPWQPMADLLRSLESDVQKILVGQGLHADEARAMVRTWSRSWFRSEGTRLMYTVPRAVTDKLLPLVITPTPDRVVRALVGRLELITPEVLAEVEQALLGGASEEPLVRAAAEARLARLGRFLEAHLRHVVTSGLDASAREAAQRRLALLAPTATPAERAAPR